MAQPESLPIGKLKRSHLEGAQAWEYCLDAEGDGESDESYVRPIEIRDLATTRDGQFLLPATFTLASKDEFPGVVEVDVLGGRVHLRPMFVFLLDRQLDPVSMETDRLLSRYTKFAGNSPKKWRLDIVLPGESKVRAGSVKRSMAFYLARFAIRVATRRMVNQRREGDGGA